MGASRYFEYKAKNKAKGLSHIFKSKFFKVQDYGVYRHWRHGQHWDKDGQAGYGSHGRSNHPGLCLPQSWKTLTGKNKDLLGLILISFYLTCSSSSRLTFPKWLGLKVLELNFVILFRLRARIWYALARKEWKYLSMRKRNPSMLPSLFLSPSLASGTWVYR